MQYREDHKAGNQISALGFGCMRFPKNMADSENLVQKAVEQGINYFDTAYMYPQNEETLGQILLKNQLRDKIFIATKLPLLLCRNTADFDKYFEKQLKRLKTDYIDYYLMHMITDLAQWKKLCSWGIEDWIAKKKVSGEIRQIGFSFHGSQSEFLAVLEAYDWEFCQIQYNYSDENYQAGVTGLHAAGKKEIPVIIMEPLLGGKLATGLPEKAVNLFREANPELSPAGWGLRWLWNQPEVTCVISGMDAMEQLEENIKVVKTALPGILTPEEEDVFLRVKNVFSESYKVPCTGCGYCMPCPKNVDIPACFAAYNTSYSIGKSTGMHQYMLGTGGTSEKPGYASLCVKCGKCETHCPQNIKIRDSLKDVGKRMEPFWWRPGMFVVHKFLHRKKK